MAPGSIQLALRCVLFTDLVESTRLTSVLGDAGTMDLMVRHDRSARALIRRFNGHEIERTDGFKLLFERPIDAVRFALEYHAMVHGLGESLGTDLKARAGLHLGEVHLRENSPEDVAQGAKPIEVEGLAVPLAARVMGLALGGQTLATRAAFDVARRAAVASDAVPATTRWLAHGPFLLKGVEEPTEIFEIGADDHAPLAAPPDGEKGRRALRPGEEELLGWRPAPGGNIVGRENWDLLEKLGEGGFGEVWLAEQRKTRERRVFKFCFNPDRLRGLKREVTLFRLLKESVGDRDDIARVIDWRFDAPPYFIESEYTEGGSLTDWAEAQGGIDTIPFDTRLELLSQVAEALAAAHSVGILHKDIKPSNILVRTGRTEAPRARLADFGIGIVTDREFLVNAGVTDTGFTDTQLAINDSSRTGTRLYAAPELLGGGRPSIQSDIYALGVMLYQLVIGDLTAPLTTDWQRRVEDPLLREDIASCVAGQPTERLGGAADLARHLRSLRARRRARLRRNLARIAAGSSVLLLVLLFSVLWWARRERETATRERTLRVEADSAREHALQQEYLARIALAESVLSIGAVNEARAALNDVPPGPRGWEWGHYMRKAYPALLEQTLFDGHFHSLAASRRQNLAAGLSQGGQFVIYDVDAPATVGSMVLPKPGTHPIMQFTEDDEHILVSYSGVVHVVRVADCTLARPPISAGAHIHHMAQHPDGRTFAVSVSGSTDGSSTEVLVGDILTGRWSRRIPGHPRHAVIRYSPDGSLLLLWGQDNAVRVLDAGTGALLLTFEGHRDRVAALGISADGKTVASAGGLRDRRVLHWNIADGHVLNEWKGHSEKTNFVLFDPKGRYVLSSAGDFTTRLHDLHSSATLAVIREGNADPRRLALSPDGDRLAVGTSDGKIYLYWLPRVMERWANPEMAVDWVNMQRDQQRRGLIRVIPSFGNEFSTPHFTSEGDRLLIFQTQGRLLVFDGTDAVESGKLFYIYSSVSAGDTSPSGRYAANGFNWGLMRTWDLHTGRIQSETFLDAATVTTLEFIDDRRVIANCISEYTSPTWWAPTTVSAVVDAPTGRTSAGLDHPQRALQGRLTSVGTRRIARATARGSVDIYDAATLALQSSFAAPDLTEVLRLSKNDELIAIGTTDGQLVVCSTDGTELHREAIGGVAMDIAFHPTKPRVAVAVGDRPGVVVDYEARATIAAIGDNFLRIGYFDGGARLFATAEAARQIFIWDDVTHQRTARLGMLNGSNSHALSTLPDGRLAIFGGDGWIEVHGGFRHDKPVAEVRDEWLGSGQYAEYKRWMAELPRRTAPVYLGYMQQHEGARLSDAAHHGLTAAAQLAGELRARGELTPLISSQIRDLHARVYASARQWLAPVPREQFTAIIRDVDALARASIDAPSATLRLIDLHETIWSGDTPIHAFDLRQSADICGKLSATAETLGLEELSTSLLLRGTTIARLLSEPYAEAERELQRRGREVPVADPAVHFAAVPASATTQGKHPSKAVEELWIQDPRAGAALAMEITVALARWMDEVAPISPEDFRELASRLEANLPAPLPPQTLLASAIEPLVAEVLGE